MAAALTTVSPWFVLWISSVIAFTIISWRNS
jgi:hypothetical protein